MIDEPSWIGLSAGLLKIGRMRIPFHGSGIADDILSLPLLPLPG